MNKKKTIFISSLFAILVTISLVFIFCILPWIIVAVSSLSSPNPNIPKITHGEFPFEFICEIDGEEFTIKDTLVIEHKGVRWNEGKGKYNAWETTLLNSSAELHNGTNEIHLKEGFNLAEKYEITLFLGSCEYFMGLESADTEYQNLDIHPGDIVINSRTHTGSLNAEALYDKYNIKVIKNSISKPLTDNAK